MNLEDTIWEMMTCTSCGFCKSVCPVYAVDGWEDSSPRSRIHISYGILRGEIDAEMWAFKTIFGSTLCTRCDVRCPSGVDLTGVIRACRSFFLDRLPDEYKPLLLSMLERGTPLSEVPTIKEAPSSSGVYYLADPTSSSSGVAKSALKFIENTMEGTGVIQANTGLMNWQLGDVRGMEEKISDLQALLKEIRATQIFVTSPEEMYHLTRNLHRNGIEISYLPLPRLESALDAEVFISCLEETRQVDPMISSDLPMIRGGCCGGGGGVFGLFPDLSMRLARESLGDREGMVLTTCPLCTYVFRRSGYDVLHVVEFAVS